MKTALVLEGGGMRGAYTCGVLDSLLENNIVFDAVIGVSAGACHGCSFVSRQKGRSIRTVTKWLEDERYMSIKSLASTGDLFNAQFIYYDIPEKLDHFDYTTFNNTKTKMYVVCTDVNTGKPLYLPIAHIQEDIEYVRASASLPFISKIVQYNGFEMLDGGLVDSIPFQHMMDLGYDKILVVTTRPEDYVKTENKLTPVMHAMYKDYPNLIEAFKNRHIMYNEQTQALYQLRDEGKLLVVSPKQALDIGRIEKNTEKSMAIYHQGYEDMQEQMESLKTYLGEEN